MHKVFLSLMKSQANCAGVIRLMQRSGDLDSEWTRAKLRLTANTVALVGRQTLWDKK